MYNIKIKRSITYILMLVLVITIAPLEGLAFIGDPNDGGGGSGVVVGNQFTWNQSQSGYRITIVNERFQPVSRSVDFLFSVPQNAGNHFYTNPRTSNGLSTSTSNFGSVQFEVLLREGIITRVPPVPIRTAGNGVAEGTGAEFREWFLRGAGSITLPRPPAPPVVPTPAPSPPASTPNPPPPPPGTPGVPDRPTPPPGTPPAPNRPPDSTRPPLPWMPDLNEVVPQDRLGEFAEVLRLDRIPLSNNNSEPVGYVHTILNYQVNGRFIFALPNMERGQNVVQTVVDRNYSVVVEPIFWFVPAAWDPNTSQPTAPFNSFVYGTITNHLEFNRVHNFRWGQTGGAYTPVLGRIGWRSMFVGSNWPFEGSNTIIRGYINNIAETATVNMSTVLGWMNSGIGVGMHIYDGSDLGPGDPGVDPTGSPTNPEPHPSIPPDVPEAADTFRVVKYYRNEDSVVDRKFVMSRHRENIQIVDEMNYRVVDWFVTTSESVGYDLYEISKDRLNPTRTGTDSRLITFENSERTLHLLLEERDGDVGDGSEIILNESEITRAISTIDTRLSNWGPREFTFTAASMAGSHPWSCGGCRSSVSVDANGRTFTTRWCSGHTCTAVFGKSNFRYAVDRLNGVDRGIEANVEGTRFNHRFLNNTLAGSVPITGAVNRITRAEYQTVIWRGMDIPTIAAFKEPASIELNRLLQRRGNVPQGNRANNGVIIRPLSISLNVNAGASDLNTHSVHSNCPSRGTIFASVTHTFNTIPNYDASVRVMIYRGNPNSKQVGNLTNSNRINTTVRFGNSSSLNASGFMVQSRVPIRFHPYIRMSYQGVGDTTKSYVNVLSQHISEILPNDFAEAAWFNPNEESLALSSTQWSLHARAVSGDQPWQGRNQVLPGGAIFQLANNDVPTRVSVVTWQTVIDAPERSALAQAIPANEFTVQRATEEHGRFRDDARDILENLHIVQWVNADVTARNAWDNNGRRVMITNGGESLTPLGLTGNSSTDSKYHIRSGTPQRAANEGRLDIIGTNESQNMFFKVFADTSGNIYLATNIGSIEPLRNINGTNLGNSTMILPRTATADQIDTLLTDELARELERRTLLISNFVRSLERNTGNDPSASWVSDGRWFNEAFEGIFVVRQATTFTVGFNRPRVRAAALDPRLTPPSAGRGDMFTRAFLSQFSTASQSASPRAQGKPQNFIGTFRGRDILLTNMEGLYRSRRFYIPNVTVQDLN